MLTLLMLIAGGGSAFFLARGVQARSGMRGMTKLELKRAELEEARSRSEKIPVKDRFVVRLRQYGYEGDMFPFIAAMAFLYLFVLVGVRVLGLAYTYGTFIALPLSIAVAVGGASYSARRRRRLFNVHLVELLDLVAGQIRAGHGAQRALTIVVPSMQEPLRGEMNKVLAVQSASRDLISAMRALAERYPSRAMAMFISALEIDRDEGQAIGPALQQAADLLKRDFALSAEAAAEISQTRGEFFAVIGILGLIAAKMMFGGDDTSREAYTSLVGIIAISVGLANVALGIWRFLRLLNKARGDM